MPSRKRPRNALGKVLAMTLVAGLPLQPCFAQSGHEALELSPTLGFHDILASTLTHAPESQETPVRQQQADAFAAAGHSWLAGRPNLALNYYNDSLLDNRGQVEAEYGLQVPLWRPGERRDSVLLGERYQTQVQLWQQALQLELAGRVRAVLADIHEAEVLLRLEREATLTAEELVRVSTAMFTAGALARVDVMQTENLLLEQRRREFQAEATLVDAEITYEFLTGLESRPAAQHTEAQSTATEIGASHPLLRYLRSDVDVMDGAVRQSEIAAKGNPQLTLGTRRERGDRFAPYTDSVNLSLTIPLGGKSFVSARTSATRRQKVDAEVLYLNTQRRLELALHDAEHELFLARQALPLAGQQAALGRERRTLAQAAFEQGELTLAQVLPAVQEARTAERDLTLLQVREQRLITEYNQLIGVLP